MGSVGIGGCEIFAVFSLKSQRYGEQRCVAKKEFTVAHILNKTHMLSVHTLC